MFNKTFMVDIPQAEELRRNSLNGRALKDCVKRTVERIKYAAENGQTYAVMETACTIDGKTVDIGAHAILGALKPYGYKEYTEPVYSGSVLQDLDFITWM